MAKKDYLVDAGLWKIPHDETLSNKNYLNPLSITPAGDGILPVPELTQLLSLNLKIRSDLLIETKRILSYQ